MNKLIIATLAFLFSATAYAGDGFDKLYAKYSGSKDITSIDLSESMISLVSKFINEKDSETKALLASVKGIKLLMSEDGNDKLSVEANLIMKSGNYEDMIKINGEDNIRIMVQENGDIINDIIVLVDSKDEFIFINITGNIDPNQVGKVLKSLDINVNGLDAD